MILAIEVVVQPVVYSFFPFLSLHYVSHLPYTLLV